MYFLVPGNRQVFFLGLYFNFTGNKLCWSYFVKGNSYMALMQVFTSEICEVFQDSYSAEHLWTAASALIQVVCTETICTERHLRSFIKKMLLKISQNSQGNACVGVSFLINLQAWGLHIYWKKTPTEGSSCEFLGTCFYIKPQAYAFSL